MGGWSHPSTGGHVYLLEAVFTGSTFLLLNILANVICIGSWELLKYLASAVSSGYSHSLLPSQCYIFLFILPIFWISLLYLSIPDPALPFLQPPSILSPSASHGDYFVPLSKCVSDIHTWAFLLLKLFMVYELYHGISEHFG